MGGGVELEWIILRGISNVLSPSLGKYGAQGLIRLRFSEINRGSKLNIQGQNYIFTC